MSVKKWFSIILIAVMLMGIFMPMCTAQTVELSQIVSQISPNSYFEYESKYADSPRPNEVIEVLGSSGLSDSGAKVSIGDYEDRTDCIIWENGEGKVSFPIEISVEGRYCIGFNYYSVSGKGTSMEYSLYIDGEYPFTDCASISFPRYYKYSSDIFLKDSNDNELRPEQVDVPMWNFSPVSDEEGLYVEPYSFYFSKGNHTITLEALRDGIVISSVVLYQPETVENYDSYITKNNKKSLSGESIIIEAEKPLVKTSPVLYPNADRSDSATSVSNPIKTRLNTMGGANWAYRNQQITWEFVVPESGYYKFGFRYKQNFLRGMSTYREVMIDGEVPFSELSALGFEFSSSWELCDTGNYKIYLEKGKHTLTLTPTLSVTADIILRTNECIARLNDAYSQIISITGVTPDMWRNYYLHESVPGLRDTFNEVYKELVTVSEDMYKITGTKGSEASLIDRICKQLKKFIKSQDAISEQLESFHSNISSLSSWSLNLQNQGLLLDRIYINPYETDFPKVRATFFENLVFKIKAFIGAFTEDYSAIGNVYKGSENSITVWTASGRDQADIIKELIDSEFVEKTGIYVNLQLVQGSLTTAVLSGRGPDVSIGGESPVSLALRDAVVELDEFSDFSNISSKYPKTLLDPFSIKGHCYALPESVKYNMMFYRTDIFEQLGLKPPRTWDEFYEVMEVLQRNNMNVGLPSDLFRILVLQMGGRIFNHSLTSTELTSNTAYKAFQMYTDFYSQYGAPIVKDDYNRFRTGELPLTIIGFDFYQKLYASAPEIRNLWAMTTIPGIEIDKNVAIITETAACIFKKSKNIDASWEFLKWWTSSETQHRYSDKVESVFGIAGRYTSADPEAFSQVAWSARELTLLNEQLLNSVALPTVPGNYYVSRNITNAFEAVLYNQKNPREALKYWINQTDLEIKRRSQEFDVGEDNTYYE